jgi:hypothetical protein
MVFLATEHRDLPTKDLLSWIFDEPGYDPNKPVLPPLPPRETGEFMMSWATAYLRLLLGPARCCPS